MNLWKQRTGEWKKSERTFRIWEKEEEFRSSRRERGRKEQGKGGILWNLFRVRAQNVHWFRAWTFVLSTTFQICVRLLSLTWWRGRRGKEGEEGRRDPIQGRRGDVEGGFLSLTHNCLKERKLSFSFSSLTHSPPNALFLLPSSLSHHSLALFSLSRIPSYPLPPTLVVLLPFSKEVRKGRRGFEHLHVLLHSHPLCIHGVKLYSQSWDKSRKVCVWIFKSTAVQSRTKARSCLPFLSMTIGKNLIQGAENETATREEDIVVVITCPVLVKDWIQRRRRSGRHFIFRRKISTRFVSRLQLLPAKKVERKILKKIQSEWVHLISFQNYPTSSFLFLRHYHLTIEIHPIFHRTREEKETDSLFSLTSINLLNLS